MAVYFLYKLGYNELTKLSKYTIDWERKKKQELEQINYLDYSNILFLKHLHSMKTVSLYQ